MHGRITRRLDAAAAQWEQPVKPYFTSESARVSTCSSVGNCLYQRDLLLPQLLFCTTKEKKRRDIARVARRVTSLLLPLLCYNSQFLNQYAPLSIYWIPKYIQP